MVRKLDRLAKKRLGLRAMDRLVGHGRFNHGIEGWTAIDLANLKPRKHRQMVMQNTLFVRELDFPVAQVWTLLDNFPRLDWFLLDHSLEVMGNGMPGTVRIITMKDDSDPVWEVLLSKDVASKTISYAVPVGLKMPVSNYIATTRLEPIGENRTRLHWHGSWLPNPGESIDDIRANYVRIYAILCDGIETVLRKECALSTVPAAREVSE